MSEKCFFADIYLNEECAIQIVILNVNDTKVTQTENLWNCFNNEVLALNYGVHCKVKGQKYLNVARQTY